MVCMSKLLSERIAAAIQEANLGIPDVARACGVKYQAVDKWIKGNSLSLKGPQLLKLAKITGFEAEWLMFGTGPRKPAITPELANIVQEPGAAQLLYSWHALAPETKHTAVRILDTLAEPQTLKAAP